MKPGAWENGKGSPLCPESMESLPGTEAEAFSIPESLTKKRYIFKKFLKDWPYAGAQGGGACM